MVSACLAASLLQGGYTTWLLGQQEAQGRAEARGQAGGLTYSIPGRAFSVTGWGQGAVVAA